MRDANEIITRNVHNAIERSIKEAAEDDRILSESDIVGRMAEFIKLSKDATTKGMDRYLRQGHVWRIDYVEAVARATGHEVAWFLVPHTPKELKEATSAQMLISAVDARLSQDESRTLARKLNQALDHRPFFDLLMRLLDLVIDGKSAKDVALAASDAVRQSAAWDTKIRSLRGKKKTAKKS